MPTVLIDTDIAIDYLRGVRSAGAYLLPLLDRDEAYMSILSAFELYAGMREREKEATENFIGACRIEPVTMMIAAEGGRLRREWRARGNNASAVDCLIAATALVRNHRLATNNAKHYPGLGERITPVPRNDEPG